jgi:hypothetical protein
MPKLAYFIECNYKICKFYPYDSSKAGRETQSSSVLWKEEAGTEDIASLGSKDVCVFEDTDALWLLLVFLPRRKKMSANVIMHIQSHTNDDASGRSFYLEMWPCSRFHY